MAPFAKPVPTPDQVREYVLTMLEGLSSLAVSAGDADTHERIASFTDDLILAWGAGAGAWTPAGDDFEPSPPLG